MITVRPISTWGIPCGIAEHTKHLIEAMHAGRHGVFVQTPDPRELDPDYFFGGTYDCEVVWLNYHAALHARWTPEQVCRLFAHGKSVVVTFHDTGVPNSLQCTDLWSAVSSYGSYWRFIVHEPSPDLPGAIYLRQGIPPWAGRWEYSLQHSTTGFSPVDGVIESPDQLHTLFGLPWGIRPRVGTVGFPFPWKNYDLLCAAATLAGWSVLLFAPGATDEQIARWRQLNPWTAVVRAFVPSPQIVSALAGCDATAFLYQCANTGTSGAIRQGIAARKPLIATSGCRQFRDLEEEPLGASAIYWAKDLSPEGVAAALNTVYTGAPIDPRIHRIAERDSWANQAAKYADVFKAVCGS